MGDFIAKAKIRTDRFVSDGIVHIGDDLIEGLFTIDYARIILDGQKISLILNECHLNLLPNGVRSSSITKTIYESNCKDRFLESPSSYVLFDGKGSILNLELTEAINDPMKKKELLENIQKFKS